MAYEVADFSVEAVTGLLSAVKEDTKDSATELQALASDLRRIRQHCTYLAQQCEDRADELDSDEDGT